MTILGRGDLSPPRRYRRHRRWPWVLVLLVLLGVGGWYAWHEWRTDGSDVVTAESTPCRVTSPPPEPAKPDQVRLRLLNGTKRNGLAHHLGQELRHRGFHVVAVGNTHRTARTAVVSVRGDLAPVAAVRVHLRQFSWAPTAKEGSPLTLVIGRDFTGLVSRERAAERRDAAVRVAHPSASPCPPSSVAS